MASKSRLFIGSITLVGLCTLAAGLEQWSVPQPIRFITYLAAAVAASGLKVTLPGAAGTLSVNFLFILFAIAEFTLSETLALGCVVTALQCMFVPGRRADAVKVSFNVASVAVAITLAYRVYHIPLHEHSALDWCLLGLGAAAVFFVANTFPVAVAIAFTERRSLLRVWRECYFWTFPYYVIGAGIAALMAVANHAVGWQTALLMVPVVYVIYRSYHLYLGRLEEEKQHAEDAASLHLRTIEALALAIEAKDSTTHSHLRRMQVYAVEIARELGLSEDDISAVRAAALLHDIGKLAIPEHIASKPGKPTPEEFEKIKIHPQVGAEILERVQFPYPVAPIVLAHHERWDGAGYPHGLSGEAIPIGARVLALVDGLEAAASDRQHRHTLTLEEAMKVVVLDSGKAYDPRVVAALIRRAPEMEQAVARLAQTAMEPARTAPPIGVPTYSPVTLADRAESDFLQSIAAAREEVQTLFELTQELGNSLSLDETLSVLSLRLRRIVPWAAMAIYVKRGKTLVPEFVHGDEFRLWSSLQIPMGEGISGWAAENKKPVVNGNPAAESGYLNDTGRLSNMGSALAVPLEGGNGVIGVLTLYRTEREAFTRDHLRVLLAITSKIGLSVDNALRFRQAESSATTDFLTGLPNARSLFLHLDSEIARSRRADTPVTVLVCDLDGFKQVNDRFGHIEGNTVLKDVAHGLRQVCREYDYVARMGGDEFVIIMPGVQGVALDASLARFREAARLAGNRLAENIIGLSVGQANFPADGNDAEDLLAEADRRMYKDKQETKRRLAAGIKLWEQDLPAIPLQ